MSNTTQAPRPAAVDLDAAREYAITQPGLLMSAWGLIDALVADLDATRAERDAAIEARRSIQAHCYGGQDLPDAISRAERAEAERDAARAALPDAQMLDSYAAGIEWEGFEADGLRKAAAAIRALDTTPVQEVAS